MANVQKDDPSHESIYHINRDIGDHRWGILLNVWVVILMKNIKKTKKVCVI